MGSQLSCLSSPHEQHLQHDVDDQPSDPHASLSHAESASKSHSEQHHHAHHRHRVKILFLDVDGVLNGEYYGYGGVDDSLLFLLKSIIEETRCKIVLSTTWRLNQAARATLLHFMKARADINVEDIIIGDTPSIKGKKRAFEIEAFLESESFQSHYVVGQWCAIDDINLTQHDPHFMKDHFVRTNYRIGITSADAFRVVQILNNHDALSNSYAY